MESPASPTKKGLTKQKAETEINVGVLDSEQEKINSLKNLNRDSDEPSIFDADLEEESEDQ